MNPLASFGRFVCAALLLSRLVVTAQPIITDADQVLGPVPAEELPVSGTFWFVQQHQPPLPWNPFPDLPVYLFGTNGGHFLVDDSQVDYVALREAQAIDRALLQAEMQLGIVQMSSLPELPGGGGGAYDPGVTNLPVAYSYAAGSFYIELLGVTNGTAFVALHGTVADELYQVFSKETLTNGGWIPESEPIIGQDSLTLKTFPIGDRTNNLFLRAMSWQDSDGSGMPDWWQLQHFGQTGMDPYSDADGDGWVNVREYENGTKPVGAGSFDTPPAPSGLRLQFNDTNGAVLLNWHPAGDAVTSYTVERDSEEPQTFGVWSGTELSDTISTVPVYPEYFGPEVQARYRVRANYTSGNSTWTDWIDVQSPVGPDYFEPQAKTVFIAAGPGTNALLAISSVPADTVAIRLSRIDFLAHFEFGSGNYDASWDIPLTAFHEGLYPLPSHMVVAPEDEWGYVSYEWWAQVVTSTGVSKPVWLRYSGALDSGKNFASLPFLDGRQQLKDNLAFVLRAANREKELFIRLVEAVGNTTHSLWLRYPTNYAYAGYYDYSALNSMESYPFLQNEFTPFRDNCLFRNFVYNYGELNPTNGGPAQTFQASESGGPVEIWHPAVHTFADPVVNGSVIPSRLAPDQTQWTYYRPLKGYSGGLSVIGMAFEQGYFRMENTARNIYGLRYLSAKLAWANDQGLQTTDCLAGSLVEAPYYAYVYPRTEQPGMQTVNYFFSRMSSWDSDAQVPCPGQEGFDPTNTSPILIAAFGDPEYKVAGWAKQLVTNSVYEVYGFLGQYFEQALLYDAAGQITADSAGVVKEYGNFLPTYPGPVGLITMPDIDTNERGTGIVHVIKLQLDVNHDGKMELAFGTADNTTKAMPFSFWVNNDFDRWHDFYEPDWNQVHDQEEDDLKTAGSPGTRGVTPDCDYQWADGAYAIPSKRDLEDYTRLWLPGIKRLYEIHTNLSFELSIRNNDTPDGPAINLVLAVDSDGGPRYLTNSSIADDQISLPSGKCIGRISPHNTIRLNDFFQLALYPGTGAEHFIWCGARRGKGELVLQVKHGTNLLAETSAWIDLKDIKEMYERWTVGDNGAKPPTNTAYCAAEGLPVGISKFQYDSPSDTNTPYILHVHGWNMSLYDKDRYAETAFKRLYLQGYQGRFGSFRWPTQTGFTTFDASEFNAWKSGEGLYRVLTNLNATYPGRVYLTAHSMGNIVAAEALRKAGTGQLVNTYVAMQAAIASHAYDGGTTNRAIVISYDSGTPDRHAEYWTNGASCYLNGVQGAERYVNFFNKDDWALGWWEFDQDNKPNNGAGYGFTRPEQYECHPLIGSVRYPTFLNDTHEIFSFCTEARCFALGEQVNVNGPFLVNEQIDLAASPYSFGNLHKGHSGQFRSTNMERWAFWEQVLVSLQLKARQ